jgi:peptidoglycan/xylan/chitin deacetylase (PgdA/CDA1 family)
MREIYVMKKTISLLFLIPLLFVSCVFNKATIDRTGQHQDQREVKSNVAGIKLCALTFDDGPDVKKTPLILDKLEAHGVVASFFVIGQLVNDSTGSVLQRAVTMGCEINNHSWGWQSMNTMTEEEIKESVNTTTAAIEKYAGTTPKFFRPPNLAVSNTMYDAIDYPFAGGVLGYDWAAQNTSAEERAQKVLNGIRDGAIILLHDVQPDPHPTPEALDILIPELKKQGYEFVTLSELFTRKGITPSPDERKIWVYVK